MKAKIAAVTTDWVDVADQTDDTPKLVAGRWQVELAVIDVDMTREEAIDHYKAGTVFELLTTPERMTP